VTNNEIALIGELNVPIIPSVSLTGSIDKNGNIDLESNSCSNIAGINFQNTHLKVTRTSFEVGATYGDPNTIFVLLTGQLTGAGLSGDFYMKAFTYPIFDGHFQAEKEGIILAGDIKTPEGFPLQIEGNANGQIKPTSLDINSSVNLKLFEIKLQKGIVNIHNEDVSVTAQYGEEQLILLEFDGEIGISSFSGGLDIKAFGAKIVTGNFSVINN